MIETSEQKKINAFEIDETENGIEIMQHQYDTANQSKFGKCQLEMNLFLPYATVQELIRLKDFKSYKAFKSWLEKVLVKYRSIHPLRDFVAKHKLQYEISLS